MTDARPERPKSLMVTVDSDDFEWRNVYEEPVGEDENGRPQYPTYRVHAGETVTHRISTPSRVLEKLLDYTNEIAQSGFATAQAKVKEALSQVIVDWTWTDLQSGDPLDCPCDNPQAFDALDMQEMGYLTDLILLGAKTPKNS